MPKLLIQRRQRKHPDWTAPADVPLPRAAGGSHDLVGSTTGLGHNAFGLGPRLLDDHVSRRYRGQPTAQCRRGWVQPGRGNRTFAGLSEYPQERGERRDFLLNVLDLM